MRWSTIEENWKAYLAQILARWPDMDEDDLDAIDGDRDAFLDYLCANEGLEPEEAEDELNEFLQGAEPADAVIDEDGAVGLGEEEE